MRRTLAPLDVVGAVGGVTPVCCVLIVANRDVGAVGTPG